MRGKEHKQVATEPLLAVRGQSLTVPVHGGGVKSYVDLDNAATTPPLESVWAQLGEAMTWYGSIHRGAGLKSSFSTDLLEKSLTTIRHFSDADSNSDALFVGSNTTGCINHLARRLNLTSAETVVTSAFEHSSNVLPWRKYCQTIEIPATTNGDLDLVRFEEVLRSNRVRLVAISAASNITGIIPDVHTVARLAHTYGAEILVDVAQLVAHRQIERRPTDSAEHLDYIAYAGHKMYAPYGIAVLIGPRKPFESGWPDQAGGGSARLIDGDFIAWADFPEREQGGTPNYLGIVGLALTCEELLRVGYERILQHELAITSHVAKTFRQIGGLVLHRSVEEGTIHSLPVFPFNLGKHHHALIAAFLGIERGIAVRSGPICQFGLVRKLLGVSEAENARIRSQVERGDTRNLYGVVRASCGATTTLSDLDELCAALKDFAAYGPQAQYEQSADGRFKALGWNPEFVLNSEMGFEGQPVFA